MMLTTLGNQLREVADIVQTVLKYCKSEDNASEIEIFKNPSNVAKLNNDRVHSRASVEFDGVLIVGGFATSGSMGFPGLALNGADVFIFKRFCLSMVYRARSQMGDQSKNTSPKKYNG